MLKSNRMLTYLIVGADEEKRFLKVEELVGKPLPQLLNNPDFILLRAEKESIGISEVRTLQEKILFKPYQKNQKTVLILEAQNLTLEAQNALLKTLEEPPPQTKIYLTAPDESSLLPTVSSRCQVIFLASPQKSTIPTNNFSSETFIQLIKVPLGQKLQLADSLQITQKKEFAKEFLKQFQSFLRNSLISGYHTKISSQGSFFSPKQYLQFLKLCSKYLFFLETNCHVSLTIDNFLIELENQKK